MGHLFKQDTVDQAQKEDFAPWLELAADAYYIGFFRWDVLNDTLQWNYEAEARLGLPPGTIDNSDSWKKYVDARDVGRLGVEIAALSHTQLPRFTFRFRFHSPLAGLRLFEGVAECKYDAEGRLAEMHGVNIDVTEREAAIESLARNEAHLQTIFETVPDAMIVIGSDGHIRTFNAAAERMFGRQSADVVGRDVAVLMPIETARNHAGYLANYLNGGTPKVMGVTRELIAQRADGNQFPIELNVAKGEDGDDLFFTGFIRDVSERHEAERRLEALRAEYLRNARLTAMGELAAGLAHELNQPLAAATSFLAAAELGAAAIPGGAGETVAAHARSAAASLKRVDEIIRRLRSFIGGQPGAPARHGLGPLIEEALALALPGPDRHQVAATIEIAPPELAVHVDAVQLQQVLVNLIRNSLEATRDRADAQIWIRAEVDNGLAQVGVADNGPGVPQAVVDNRNLPFVSSKGPDSLGLGLSICRRILETLGTGLTLRNRPEGGALASFALPLSEPEA